MSEFSKLLENASADIEHIQGQEKQTSEIESLAGSEVDIEIARSNLDEAEERNSVAIELLKDVDLATESRDLTVSEYRILKSSLRAITNAKILKPISMEDAEGTQLRPIAMEGIKDTLKKFWSFIKEQAKKFWSLLRRWWIKCFDISKRLKKRVELLIKSADDQYGSASETTMDLPEISKLTVAGKYNDPSLIVRGLKDLEEVTFEFINDTTSELFNDVVNDLSDKTSRVIEGIYSAAKDIVVTQPNERIPRDSIFVSKNDIDSIKQSLSKVLSSADNDLINVASFNETGNVEKYKKQHGESEDEFKRSVNLPGDKWILSIQPTVTSYLSSNHTSLPDIIEYVRRSKLLITSCFYTEKKYDTSIQVRVLSPSLVSRGCESISKICDYVYEYRQAFEKRDKFKERVIKDIDRLIDEVIDDTENSYAEVDRSVRSFANSITGLIRRRADFETSLCSYAISTGVAYANYCEKSLKLYSK